MASVFSRRRASSTPRPPRTTEFDYHDEHADESVNVGLSSGA
eukprot:CAMPEP_0113587868 /NCGR_PEP_ID=MMETSP0015_2-20120614/35166_1 /TAXON_ID=2838 /ORGANISM="Odontella" /LENGTH=41 /DNA_ID=CAMNT_0000493613 /DNA_START=335 /DNA_END=457 /DNA_ORIENTATION=+ /assembly_acc=CAM_ASM_000160